MKFTTNRIFDKESIFLKLTTNFLTADKNIHDRSIYRNVSNFAPLPIK